MKVIVRNAKGVNIRTAPVDGGIIRLALAGTELEASGVISINHDTWVKLKEPQLYQNKLVDGYVVVKANNIQYCLFASEDEEPSDTYDAAFRDGWNACLSAISLPPRK